MHVNSTFEKLACACTPSEAHCKEKKDNFLSETLKNIQFPSWGHALDGPNKHKQRPMVVSTYA